MELKTIQEQVKWRDLMQLNLREKLIENLLCWPWLFVSLALAAHEYYLLALPFSAIYFLAALRQSHNGYHNALGISQLATNFTLLINSPFMLASLHAIKLNHMVHHRHNLDEEDYERTVSEMTWWRVLLHGPKHWWHNHFTAFSLANSSEKRWLIAELSLVIGLISIAMIFQIHVLLYHLGAVFLGELLLPFFTIWITHHGHDEHSLAHIRRNKWLNLITMNMLLHYEHHLFPAVPAIKLGELSRRVEEVEKRLKLKGDLG